MLLLSGLGAAFAAMLLLVGSVEEFGKTAHRRDRRAQFVAHHVDDAPPDQVRVFLRGGAHLLVGSYRSVNPRSAGLRL